MKPLCPHARRLVYTLLGLMMTRYQRENLEALLGLFLQATGRPLPALCTVKSASALSRFLNVYGWPVRKLIRTVRRAVLEQALAPRGPGRRPIVQVVVDLTSLEKTGKFVGLDHWIHVLNGKRGLHLVVLYLVMGSWRLPWGVRVWQGDRVSRGAGAQALAHAPGRP